MEIAKFIDLLRNSDEYLETIFTEGSCYRFAKLLEGLFPGGQIMLVNLDHAVYQYEGALWDITGKVDVDAHVPNEELIAMAEKWSFAKHNLVCIGYCDNCDEPFTVETKQERKAKPKKVIN